MFKKTLNSDVQKNLFVNAFVHKLTPPERVTVVNYGGELYSRGLHDGFWYAVGSYVLWKVGKWTVNEYINYKIEQAKTKFENEGH